MNKRQLVTSLILGVALFSWAGVSWAGNEASNVDGSRDGKYRVQFEDNHTRKRTEIFEAKVEGNFLTVHYPDGDVTYKVNEWFDRRTELEVSVYDNKNGRYMTGHLDDGSHFMHKETQDLKAQERAEKAKQRQEKILARKKQILASTPTPSPRPSSSPSPKQ